MADQKTTALTELTAALLSDIIEIVDDPSGSPLSKKITLLNLLYPPPSTEASSATPTINTDQVNAHSITAIGTAITSMTTNLSGTPVNFQRLVIRFKDDGTGRAITWGASFEARGVALPGTTTANKRLTTTFEYDTVGAKWGCIASVDEA